MIIDTKGFEIGDEVWLVIKSYNCQFTPYKNRISSFTVYKDGIIYADTLVGLIGIKRLHHTEQECQLACDKLNLKL